MRGGVSRRLLLQLLAGAALAAAAGGTTLVVRPHLAPPPPSAPLGMTAPVWTVEGPAATATARDYRTEVRLEDRYVHVAFETVAGTLRYVHRARAPRFALSQPSLLSVDLGTGTVLTLELRPTALKESYVLLTPDSALPEFGLRVSGGLTHVPTPNGGHEFHRDGLAVLRIGTLSAVDAADTELPVRLTLDPQRGGYVEILEPERWRKVRYPVVLDPLIEARPGR